VDLAAIEEPGWDKAKKRFRGSRFSVQGLAQRFRVQRFVNACGYN